MCIRDSPEPELVPPAGGPGGRAHGHGLRHVLPGRGFRGSSLDDGPTLVAAAVAAVAQRHVPVVAQNFCL
eukprot:6469140-Alexandrium_andersonii.AAC.1